MNRTKIEWCDYTINPVKGLCPMACSYCYARAMYKRFKWNPEIRFEPPYLFDLDDREPSCVFVGSTMELFGEWVKPEWMHTILNTCNDFKAHDFIFLTKLPHNLKIWSPFPPNCWVGVSVTANGDMTNAMTALPRIEAGKRFISFEPLLGSIGMNDHRSMKGIIDWVIIGAQTPYSGKTAPRTEWVREITDTAKSAGIAVFHKNNLGNIFDADGFPMRQEFPL